MKTNDQWDPKYPKDRPLWADLYLLARAAIHDRGSRWCAAFAAIVEADKAGTFKTLRYIYSVTHDLFVWRSILWELCLPTFQGDDWTTWPAYARAVREAVPEEWLKTSGHLQAIPASWYRKEEWRRLWTFKSTTLLVAGLIEGHLSPVAPTPVEAVRFGDESLEGDLREFVNSGGKLHLLIEEYVDRALENKLQPFLERLDKLERGPF